MTSPRDRRREAGFTLIELLVVLTILGLVMAMTVPLLAKGSPSVTLSGAATEIRGVLGAARFRAIAEDRAITFRGDGADGYWIDGRHSRVPGGVGAGLWIGTTGGSQIAFYPSGGSSGGRVVLRATAMRREIRIDAITGHATLEP